MEPVFLDLNGVLLLHEISILKHGGDPGIRDAGLVESAVAAGRNTFYYANGSVFDIAAAYAFHIAEAQAFVDGNKRTGAAAAIVFLDVNGYSVAGADDALYNALIEIANHRLDKNGLSELIRRLAKKD